MREFLFRGIPKDDTIRHFFSDIWKDDCEGSFVYGSLIVSKDRYYICVSALCKINSCINNGMASMIEVIPETVGQYTGLPDKNGTKIFEEDIVDYDYFGERKIGKVLFNGCGYEIENEGCFLCVQSADKQLDCEVIGNIHDNPELLKGGEG